MGAAKRRKVAAEEMGLPGSPKKTCAASDCSASRNFAEDEGFAGLDFYAGEVELRAEAGEGGFDEVVFACGDAAGNQEHVGFGGLCEGCVEGFGRVGGSGEDDGFTTGAGDEGGKHGCVGIADFSRARCGVDGDEFVAGGENGDAWAGEDLN